jgi:cyclophilin family peptidyl-prolyl cis-trans isomerase
MRRARWILIAAALGAAAAHGAAQTGAGKEKAATATGRAAVPLPAKSPDAGALIVLETIKGPIVIETYPKEAPKTVEHILALVKRNFYNGLRVHRVVKGFVVQFGDPQTRDMTKKAFWGTGGSGKPIGVAEANSKRPHRLGAVAMAHAGDPRGADSQMYITLAPQPRLDGDYTVFGQVIAGMDVVNALAVDDLIRRASVK